MQKDSSARRTCSDPRSASEYTAAVLTPSSRQARITRTAISPRLAMRILENMLLGRGIHEEQRLAVLHRGAVFDQDPRDAPGDIAGDLVEHLHRFEDADGLADVDLVPFVDERLGVGFRRPVERPDNRRGDGSETGA